ncbi:MAG: GNAT family N-acetyltransferase [Candidatus Thorarchaeota archaeon]
MIEFVPYDSALHKDDFLMLNVEYLSWDAEMMLEKHDVDVASLLGVTAEGYADGLLDHYGTLEPPDGIVYLIKIEGKIEGMGALHRLESDVAEIKRMYIRQKHRGKGLGKKMLRKLVEKAREFGYSSIRLDTGDYMKAAHQIYRSEGFIEIDQYQRCETPEPFLPYTLFMEKKL